LIYILEHECTQIFASKKGGREENIPGSLSPRRSSSDFFTPPSSSLLQPSSRDISCTWLFFFFPPIGILPDRVWPLGSFPSQHAPLASPARSACMTLGSCVPWICGAPAPAHLRPPLRVLSTGVPAPLRSSVLSNQPLLSLPARSSAPPVARSSSSQHVAELPGALVRPCSPSSRSSLLLCSSAARARRRAPAPAMARTPASMDVAPAACSPCLSSPSSFPSPSHGRLRAHPAPALFLPRPSPFFHGRRRFPVPRSRPAVPPLSSSSGSVQFAPVLDMVAARPPALVPCAPHLPPDPLLISLLRTSSSLVESRPMLPRSASSLRS
jgi:hypothetical protein